MNWVDTIARLSAQNTGFVLLTVLSTEGSAPRNANAKMIVTEDNTFDSIGGGNLEFEALKHARELLTADQPATVTRNFSLGKELAQCCGGKVTLLLECFPPCRFNIALFGAGHVGTALVTILSQLPCRVRWLDARENIFPPQVAGNIETVAMKNPFAAVEDCPPDSYYLVMTHSHETDLEICEAVLARTDIRYCGLIGSKSKAAKFRSRLKAKGFTEAELGRLTCPIGLGVVGGKLPMEIGVGVAGELLAMRGSAAD